MKIAVEKELCVGSGLCVIQAPEVFDQDALGVSFVRATDLSPENRSRAEDAAFTCPSGAITIEGEA